MGGVEGSRCWASMQVAVSCRIVDPVLLASWTASCSLFSFISSDPRIHAFLSCCWQGRAHDLLTCQECSRDDWVEVDGLEDGVAALWPWEEVLPSELVVNLNRSTSIQAPCSSSSAPILPKFWRALASCIAPPTSPPTPQPPQPSASSAPSHSLPKDAPWAAGFPRIPRPQGRAGYPNPILKSAPTNFNLVPEPRLSKRARLAEADPVARASRHWDLLKGTTRRGTAVTGRRGSIRRGYVGG